MVAGLGRAIVDEAVPLVKASCLRAVHLVDHTPGDEVILALGVVVEQRDGAGDCLFPGGVGNTWEDPERFASLEAGVVAELFERLPDEAWVYPGHGNDTTIGAERPHLPDWRPLP